MSHLPDESGRGAPPTWSLAALVTGVLVLGGAGGFWLNNVFASDEGGSQPPAPPAAPAAAVTPPAAEPAVVPAAAVRPTTALRPRLPALSVVAPPDPFKPAPVAPVVVARQPASVLPPATGRGAAQAAWPAPEREPEPEPAQAPQADRFALVGIIQGDPSLVVVQYEGQSFYLKVGDQVADTWRLVEIKERSAVFQLGAQRVEVPIQGGSS